jgi:signal transduction histidine kinase
MQPVWLRLSCVLLGLVFSAPTLAEGLPRAVLLLDQSAPISPFGERFRAVFATELSAAPGDPIGTFVENLDIGRFQAIDYPERLQSLLRAKYLGEPIGVLAAIGSAAAEVALPLRDTLWPDAALVVLDFDAAAARKVVPPKSLRIVAPLRFANLIRAAKVVAPGLNRLALVGDRFEAQPFRRHYSQELSAAAAGLQIDDLSERPLSELRSRLQQLPNDSVVVYTATYRDGAKRLVPAEVLKAVAGFSPRPVVVDAESQIGTGSIGGLVLNTDLIARSVAGATTGLLSGTKTADGSVVVVDAPRFIFDWREIVRNKLTGKRFPAGTELRFRTPTVWEANPILVAAIAAAVVLQSAIIFGLLVEHRRRQVAERNLRAFMLELATMDRSATLGALSTSLAHELSQPLGAILASAEAGELLIRKNAASIDDLKEILADIRRDDHRATEIINRLRKLMRSNKPPTEAVEVRALMADMLQMVEREAANRRVALRLNPGAHLVYVAADAIHLQQVLLNLVVNAMDAIQEAGRSGVVQFNSVVLDDGTVMLSIADDGIGIPERDLETVFKAHHTTKQSGSGLGLFICRHIVTTYGGKIWAERRTAGGTVFRIVLLPWKEEDQRSVA